MTFNAGVWAWANGFYSPRVGGLAGSANIALKCGNGNGSVAFVAGCNNSSTTYSGIFSDGSTIGGGNSIVRGHRQLDAHGCFHHDRVRSLQ